MEQSNAIATISTDSESEEMSACDPKTFKRVKEEELNPMSMDSEHNDIEVKNACDRKRIKRIKKEETPTSPIILKIPKKHVNASGDDFGPVKEVEINVCSNRPNHKVIICESRSNKGNFFAFNKKGDKIASGNPTEYYVCFRCEKKSGARRARVTARHGRLITDPEVGHGPNCTSITEPELEILTFRKNIVDFGLMNGLSPMQTYNNFVQILLSKYDDVVSKNFLSVAIPAYKSIRSYLYKHVKLDRRTRQKRPIPDRSQDFGEPLFLTTNHRNRQLLACRCRNTSSTDRIPDGGQFYIFRKTKSSLLATDQSPVSYFACYGCLKIAKTVEGGTSQTGRVIIKSGRIVTDPELGHDERCIPVSAAHVQSMQIKREIVSASAELGCQPLVAYDHCVQQLLSQHADDQDLQISLAANIPSYKQLRSSLYRAVSKNRYGRTTLVPLSTNGVAPETSGQEISVPRSILEPEESAAQNELSNSVSKPKNQMESDSVEKDSQSDHKPLENNICQKD